MPLKYSSFLNSDVDWSPEEITAGKKWLKWEDLTINWENIDLLWEEIFILLEVEQAFRKRGGGDIQGYIKGNPWDVTKRELQKEIGEEKTKKFIKLVCKINNLDYEEVVEPNTEIKVTAEHIIKVLNEGVKVGVKI